MKIKDKKITITHFCSSKLILSSLCWRVRFDLRRACFKSSNLKNKCVEKIWQENTMRKIILSMILENFQFYTNFVFPNFSEMFELTFFWMFAFFLQFTNFIKFLLWNAFFFFNFNKWKLTSLQFHQCVPLGQSTVCWVPSLDHPKLAFL